MTFEKVKLNHFPSDISRVCFPYRAHFFSSQPVVIADYATK